MKQTAINKHKVPSWIKWLLWVLLVQFILINISAASYAHRLTKLRDGTVNNTTTSSNIFIKTWKLFTGPIQLRTAVSDFPRFKYDTIAFYTSDKKRIDCWYGLPDSGSKGTVIMVHGITSNKGTMTDEAYAFIRMGYRVLLMDLRGHGNSEGNSTTIGYRETEEIKLAYDFVKGKGEQKIYAYGISLGAVVIIKAVHDYDLELTGIVADLPFASLQSYLKARARMLGFPEQPFSFLTTAWIGIEKGFNGYAFKTTHYAVDVKCPVLLQVGALDAFVPMSDSQKIYEALGSSEKKMVIYGRAGHESLMYADPMKWGLEMEKFFRN